MALGAVAIVGAGPGDPDLVTVRALERLRAADVVVYDRLVDRRLLDAAPRARRIFAGKAPARHSASQDEINALLIEHARRGRRVVRLKGGDPFVFGRGGEEALALVEAGIPFEIVPGVSSAVAAPAFAGIPVTHRGVARSFTVVSGHSCATAGRDIDWKALAAAADTLVILMGVERLAAIAAALIAGGRAPSTPAAVVHRAATAAQRTVVAPLDRIAIAVAEAGLDAPATIVIGDVVRLSERLAWCDAAAAPGPSVRARVARAATAAVSASATRW